MGLKHCGKGESTAYWHFLIFAKCFNSLTAFFSFFQDVFKSSSLEC